MTDTVADAELLREFDLDRLDRALWRRTSAATPAMRSLLDRAIASLYQDCVRDGAGREAMALLRSHHGTSLVA